MAGGVLLAGCEAEVIGNPPVPVDAGESGDDAGTPAEAEDARQPGPSDGGMAMGSGLPCEVRELLMTQCSGCHGETPLPGAIVSLVTRADLLSPSPLNPLLSLGQVSLERMRSTTMPMPPGSLLPESAVAAFAAWVEADMPAGTCDGDAPPVDPFAPLTRDAALLKVKTFLTGLPPSAAEYTAYQRDDTALPGLINQWMATPQLEERMLDMFELLFQQRTDGDDFGSFLRFGDNALAARYEVLSGVAFKRDIRESFARTAWDLVSRNRPFTEVLTTRTYMLNVPLMMLLAYRDGARPQDDLRLPELALLNRRFPNLAVSFTQTQSIPYADSINPASANFGRFSLAAAPNGSVTACAGALDTTYRGPAALTQIFLRILRGPGRQACWGATSPLPDLFTAEDRALRPVTLRLATASNPVPAFWDLARLRTADTLDLSTEYFGFMGSLGFLSYWVTNDGNEHRGTANQALIVALGTTVAANDSNVPQDDAAVDEAHAMPGSVCYGCHKTLDPLRDFFRHSYTYAGSSRRADNPRNEPVPATAVFDIPGAPPVQGRGVGALAGAFATHPGFPLAWTRKVCGLLNAGRCSATNPEIRRIAAAFAASNHSFRVLLRELLSSPIVTHQTRTASADDLGIEAGNALRSDFCRRLSNRLGIRDACNLEGQLTASSDVRREVLGYARSIPEVSYPRGEVDPDMVTAPSAFTTAAHERLCESIARALLLTATGGGSTPIFSASNRQGSVDALVGRVMGVAPNDPRAEALRATLDRHWVEVVAQGSSAEVALQSTFTLACTAPLATGTGL